MVLSSFIKAEDPILELIKKLEEFTKKYPQEKVYLHLDKPYYAIGDDIWFKAYVIDAKTAAPTDISNILYVELINEKGILTKQLKLPMTSGIVWGDFSLPDSLVEGNYRIRAYSQWMRNADPAYFYDKTIKIGNYWANKIFTKTNNIYSLENEVEKVKSTIQFNNKDGKPISGTAIVFETQLNGKTNAKGSMITNTNGEIVVEIVNKEPLIEKTGNINLSMLMPDGSKVNKIIPITAFSTKVDIQFLPEGGRLIENLPCKVAFKSTNNTGLGESINGIVIDEQGAEVLSFESTYLGMGSFSLTPMPKKTYTAKIKFANGIQKTIKLPTVENSGYLISVNNIDSTKMIVKVMLTEDLLNKGELSLIAQQNGRLLASIKVPTTKQISSIILPKLQFPSGIIQLTLFSPENLPISERMVFVKNISNQIEVNFNNLKNSYKKKENVSINLNANNGNVHTQGSFSIAITNTNIIAPDLDNESNILTGLLINPEINGFIEKPNHYFLKNDIQTNIELDQLMMTQAWRKINWKEVNNSKLVESSFQAEKSLRISGTVTKAKKPVENGKITLLSSSKGMFVTSTTTDENGHFSFNEMSFGDSIRFVIQASTKDDKKDVSVKLDNFPDQAISQNKNNGDIEVNVNTSMLNYLKESNDYFDEQYKKGFLNRTNLLKTVNIFQKVNRNDSASVNSSNLNGRGNADKIFTAKDLENAYSLSQFISQGRIMGIADSSGHPYSTRLPIGASRPDGTPPEVKLLAISVDGMILENFSLDDLQISEIESVEVLQSVGYLAIYGSAGVNGVLVITTKRGKGRTAAEINAPGIVIFSPKGYDVARQFYSPKYEVTNLDKTPDLRSTVYWNPNLITDVNGKANINYYNTDQTGNYRIVIEGIDSEGNLARKVVTYQVN